MGKILRMIKSLLYINRYKAEMESRLESIETRLKEQKDDLDNFKDGGVIVDQICSNIGALMTLNNKLSGTPVIWGDETRLHISEKSAVYAALFNVNSGEITIGDYSFAGSNVVFLTGSHDMNLTGLLRRDCEIKEGNDIKVGEGVWFASNTTILGPCEIGDNAVIAAGAVVLPGTIIKEYEVYGGVPARKIGQIEKKDMTIENASVKSALEREGGLLFVNGWSEKTYVNYKEKGYCGHYVLSDPAVIFTNRKKLELFYEVDHEEEVITITIDGKDYEITQKHGILTIDSSGVIMISVNTDKYRIFFGDAN